MLDDFIARKHGRQRIQYPHPSLEPILRDTYGVIVYQEQVMQIAQVLAGFSLGAADLLRRAMGKKKADVMAAQRAVFVKGSTERGVDAAVAGDIFDLMEKFAEYGFNKSHSAAYALVTYHTAYLKHHHPVEFAAALLTNDKDASEKVAKQIRAARHQGLEVLPPDVNRSGADFDAVDGKILFGMAGVKGVGGTAVESIVEARTQDGPFKSLFDFCERVDLRRVTKKTLEALIKSGAFDFCGQPRARLVALLDFAFDRAQQVQRDKAAGQSSLFDLFGGGGPAAEPEIPADIAAVGEWAERELLGYEKEFLGFYVSGHPLDRFADQIAKYASSTVESLPRLEPFSRVTLAGIVSSVRVRPFRSGDGRMAICQFEDLTGSVEIIAMNEDYDRYEELLTSEEPLLVTGQVRIDRDEDDTKVSVRLGARGRRGEPESDEPQVLSLANVRAERARRVELSTTTRALTAERLERLRAVLGDIKHNGRCETWLRVRTEDDCEVLLALRQTRVTPSDELQHAVHTLFDGACVVRTY
jgi:DNA polymerase-3 subunit alpha